jgi:hypothetical protein
MLITYPLRCASQAVSCPLGYRILYRTDSSAQVAPVSTASWMRRGADAYKVASEQERCRSLAPTSSLRQDDVRGRASALTGTAPESRLSRRASASAWRSIGRRVRRRRPTTLRGVVDVGGLFVVHVAQRRGATGRPTFDLALAPSLGLASVPSVLTGQVRPGRGCWYTDCQV